MPSLSGAGNTVKAPLLLVLGLPLPLLHPCSVRAGGIGHLERQTALVVEQSICAVAGAGPKITRKKKGLFSAAGAPTLIEQEHPFRGLLWFHPFPGYISGAC